jgi:hypothetical protein
MPKKSPVKTYKFETKKEKPKKKTLYFQAAVEIKSLFKIHKKPMNFISENTKKPRLRKRSSRSRQNHSKKGRKQRFPH